MVDDDRRLLAILFTDIVGYTATMGADERRGIQARESHRHLIQSLSAQFHGSFVDESGDASLSVFPSAVDAVHCAQAIQAVLAAEPAYQVRIGLHVGDVVEREGRFVGDGINVASRLPALADPGGIIATEAVVEHLRNQNVATMPLGAKQLKNVAHPVRVFAVSGRPKAARSPRPSRRAVLIALAVALVAAGSVWWIRGGAAGLGLLAYRSGVFAVGPRYEQQLAFASASDGVRIAYATTGQGSPIVIVLGWFTHIERGANSPGFNPWVPGLIERHQVVLYDGRGTGLSDRDIRDFSLDAKVRDLEAVVEAARLERFALYAISAGGPTSIAYAVRHPERVTRIAFFGSFLHLDCPPGHIERWHAMVPAMRIGWGEDNPAFRQVFTSLFMPDGGEVEKRVFNEFQRVAASPDDAANFVASIAGTDVREMATQVHAPVLVAHLRGDQIVPYECGREVAARIPGAKLTTLEGRNHAVVDPQEVLAISRTVSGFFDADLQRGDLPATAPASAAGVSGR